MGSEPKPMDPERLARLRAFIEQRAANLDDSIARQLVELLADRDYQAQRADAAESRADMFERRAGRYEAVLAELPGECWPEYEGSPAVHRLVARAEIGRQWEEDSSLERWFPLTAERLKESERERDEARHILAEIDDVLTVDAREPPDSRESIPWIVASMISDLRGKDEFIERSERFRKAAEAEVARLRSRVRVEAEDCVLSRVTWRHVEAWLVKAGWTARYQSHGKAFLAAPDAWTKVIIGDVGGPARAINTIAGHLKRAGLDILDEIAAMEVPA